MKSFFKTKKNNNLQTSKPIANQNNSQSLDQQNLWEKTMDLLEEGIIIIDSKNKILYLNKRTENIFALNNNYLNQNIFDFIQNSQIKELIDAASNAINSTKLIKINYPKEKVLQVKTALIKSAPKKILVIVNDITPLNQLADVKKDFITNVSHELRTPISTLKALVETLLAGAKDDPLERENFLNDISHEIERLFLLSRDIIDLSKVESEEIKPVKQKVNLNNLITQIIGDYKLLANKKNIMINKKLPEKSVSLLADESQLDKAFSNLIDNAIKYTPVKGQVTIELKELENKAKIVVKDNGIGIGQKEIPRIFERFYRVDKGRSKATGGTGLGLSIAKHVIENNNGSIKLKSTLGKGSEFIVKLPINHLENS